MIKTEIFNTVVTANTDFFVPLAPTNNPSTFRVGICIAASAPTTTAPVLSVERTNGGVSVLEVLNSGSPLVSGSSYIFDILVGTGDTISLQTTAAGTLTLNLILREIPQ